MIATVGSEAKAAVARDCSGDHAIRYTQENFMARVAQVTAGHGVDVAYTLIGAESVASIVRRSNAVSHISR